MKLTRERKIYIAVLSLGLGALVLDRLAFAPTAAAGSPAHTAVKEGAALHSPSITGVPARGGNTRTISMAEQLRAFREKHPVVTADIKNVFQLSPAWFPAAESPETAPAVKVDPLERFSQDHRLSGTMVADWQSQAIIDGKILFVGQVLDGFRLVSVTQKQAVLESPTGRVILQIPGNGVPAGGNPKP